MKLPRTLAELNSTEGQAQLDAAEKLLTALQNMTITVVSSSNVQSQGSIIISGSTAELFIRLQ